MKRQASKNLTRREMLKLSGGMAACAPVISPTPDPARLEPAASQLTAPKGPVYKVVRPTGDVTVQMITQPSRLATLNGKTICMVNNGAFKSWVTAPLIEGLLRQKFPDVKVIPAADMPRSQKAPGRGTTTPESDAMIAALKQKGCQALISGNGG